MFGMLGRRWWLAFFGLAVVICGFLMLVQACNWGRPEISLTPQDHDFGKALTGTTLRTQITLRNSGHRGLHIYRVSTTCGCLTTFGLGNSDKRHQTVRPGGNISFEVVLDTRGKIGPILHRVTIESDDPVNPELSAVFTAYLTSLFAARPDVIQLGEVSAGSTIERAVTLSAGDGGIRWEVERAEPLGLGAVITAEWNELEHAKDEVSPGSKDRYQLKVRVTAPRRPGPFDWGVAVYKPDDSYPVLTIPVRGHVVPEIRFARNGVVIASCSSGSESVYTVDCFALNDDPWELQVVEKPDGVQVQILPGDSSRERRVEIRWKAPETPGLVRQRLVFATGRESLPQVELPIYARVE